MGREWKSLAKGRDNIYMYIIIIIIILVVLCGGGGVFGGVYSATLYLTTVLFLIQQ